MFIITCARAYLLSRCILAMRHLDWNSRKFRILQGGKDLNSLEMEKLIANQEVTGKEIQRIISNFGKDPAQRKTLDYYQERLRRLEEAWDQFEATDTEIRNHPDVQPQDDYFISEYYTSIASLHSKYKELFEAQLQTLSSNIEASKAPTQIQKLSSNIEARKTSITQENDSARANHIRQLLRKSNTIRGQLDHALRSLAETPSGQSTAFYQVQKQAISEYWQQVEAAHYQICETVDDPESLGYDVEGFFSRQDQVLSANVLLTVHLHSSGPQQTPINDQSIRYDGSMKIKLPKIEIPKFDGNYLNWRQFHDLFSEVVHKQDISPCEKLWYLRANLSGEAGNLIKHLPLSNENYSAAWQLLKERYENPRLIANALLSNLLGQSSHTTESAASIKSLHDTTRECLKGLENVGVSTTGWDPLLLFIIIRKLHKTTHVLYEQSLDHPRNLQTIKGLLSFLENRFQSLEALGSKTKSEDEKRSSSAKTLTVVTTDNCIACNAPHPLFACKTFLTFTPENRLKLIQKHSRCVNCLQADHLSKNCTRGTCRHCSKKHNTLLHLDKKQGAAGKKTAQRDKFEALSSTTTQAKILKHDVGTQKPPVEGNKSDQNLQQLNRLSMSLPFCRPSASAYQSYRYFGVCPILYDNPSSKVEKTIQKLKDKQKSEDQEAARKLDVAERTTIPETPKPVVVKKSLGQRIWAELVHYYHGFRLLFIDINISLKLLWRVLKGNQLNRRERRLLIRTTSDLFRLVPFSIFIIVPFMELLLPVFIKFFPGMLPSTFQTAKEREDKLKQSLKVKVEVAKFLQHTLDHMALQNKDHESEEAKEFVKLFRKVRNPNEYVSNDEIIKFAKQFEDEITLDSLSREQLTALCRILELNTLGTNNFLRFQLRMKLRTLAADDRLIQRDGVDSLNLHELQSACRARGMRAYGMSETRLRNQLQEWIDLSLDEKVPPMLLLLSRALMVPDETSAPDKLKATLKALPETVATQTKAAIGEREGKIDNKTRIEILREEERKIKEERDEQREVEKEKEREKAELLVDKAKVIEEIPALQDKKSDEGISSKDANILHEALESISKEKKLIVEKEVIKELKEEIEDYKEDIEELKEVTETAEKAEIKKIKETRGAKILFNKVNKMISQLDDVITRLEAKEKALKAQPNGKEETVNNEEDDTSSIKGQKYINVKELSLALRKLLKTGDEARISNIENFLEKMDVDNDGNIKVDEVIKVIETIRDDNVQLDGKQMDELIELLSKEQYLEAEEKIEKALAKRLKESKQQISEQIIDVAPVIEDKAEDLSTMDEKHILTKNEQTVRLSGNVDNLRVDPIKETTDEGKEKVLPNTQTGEIPTIPPPPISSATSNVNQKDKMI